jgi:hypothetical protein
MHRCHEDVKRLLSLDCVQEGKLHSEKGSGRKRSKMAAKSPSENRNCESEMSEG